MRPKIVIAYDATPAAADGLALGALLADLRGADILVARVLPHTRSGEATERALQASFHATIQETRETAAEFLGDRPFEVWPVFGESVADGIDDLAGDQRAELIVFGSPHHGMVGRALLGDTALAASVGAPCALAIAPSGFRDLGTLDPPVVGVAFDGSAESQAAVDAGLALARAAGATLRLITVEPSGWSRPIRHHAPVGPTLALLASELEDGAESGDASAALAFELRPTAAVATGAAAVMVAAALPFMFGDLINVRQFGIGLAIAVVLDGLIVRPVPLPAAVQLLGRRSWWATAPDPIQPTAPGGAS